MERKVQRAHRAALIPRNAAERFVDMPRIRAAEVERVELLRDKVCVLVVASDGRRFADSVDAVRLQMHEQRHCDIFRGPRDGEGVAQMKSERLVTQLRYHAELLEDEAVNSLWAARGDDSLEMSSLVFVCPAC